MRLTVLGASASYAGPGHACSGYLLEGAGVSVMLDCGNGSIANLGKVTDPATLDAVFITHAHPDHFVDLYSLQALLRYAPQGPLDPLPLYLPEGLFERLKALLSARGAADLDAAFSVRTLADRLPVRVGGLEATPVTVKHTDPTFALRVRGDGALFTYGADASPGPEFEAAISGADLALVEATLPAEYANAAPHLTAGQAGAAAAAADVGTLVLTHLWPTNDRALTARQAVAAFGGEVHVASEFDVYEIVGRT